MQRRFPVYKIHNTIKVLYLQAKICYAKERFCCAFAGCRHGEKRINARQTRRYSPTKMSFPARIRRVAAYPRCSFLRDVPSYLQANARRRFAASGIGKKRENWA